MTDVSQIIYKQRFRNVGEYSIDDPERLSLQVPGLWHFPQLSAMETFVLANSTISCRFPNIANAVVPGIVCFPGYY